MWLEWLISQTQSTKIDSDYLVFKKLQCVDSCMYMHYEPCRSINRFLRGGCIRRSSLKSDIFCKSNQPTESEKSHSLLKHKYSCYKWPLQRYFILPKPPERFVMPIMIIECQNVNVRSGSTNLPLAANHCNIFMQENIANVWSTPFYQIWEPLWGKLLSNQVREYCVKKCSLTMPLKK